MRQGGTAGLVLVALEVAAEPELARISRAMQARLSSDARFSRIAGGEAAWSEADELRIFAQRHLLSPLIRPEIFETAALRRALEEVLRGLRSSAAPLVARYALPDPIGAFPAWLAMLGADHRLTARDGAWFVTGREAPRAVILAVIAGGGTEMAAQEAGLAAITDAFTLAEPGPARLLLAGPAVIAREASRGIRADVDRIAVISTLLVVALLAWRFRSLLVLAALAVPVLLSVALGIWLTGLFFGSVHAIALGFGVTMLGVTLDYPVLLLGHRKHHEAAHGTRARIRGAFWLAVATATLGLGGLVFSGFPGLAQLGVLAAIGLLAAAAATWWLLPPLVVAAQLAPVAAGEARWVHRLEGARRFRAAAIALALLAGGALLAVGGPRWETDLAALSPVPDAARALDAELREALGAAEAGQFLLVRGPDAQTVLQRQEALLPRLDRLVEAGVIGGYEAAALILPSMARQLERRAALPAPELLAARLAEASIGLPFRPAAFQPFEAAVAAARVQAPWSPAELADTALGLRLAPLLGQRGDGWQGAIQFRGVTSVAALAQALEAPGAVFIDVRTELDGILAGFGARSVWLLALAGLAILLVLALGLRRPARILRVLGAIAAAQIVTLAVLRFAGVSLSPIHLAALLLVGGVGLDYALFMARENLDMEERARTLRTLITCNAMTLLTFGLLATCATPILRDIGATVALGAALSLGFAFLIAAPPRLPARLPQ
ncbi:MMPL family transporter [Sediminicoccus sp. KRV36]|uniref:MMPL family transporter n=1 Tax=Sediminicoccus sp. KRV36 TaxID=3133721 RepID=UPI00200EF43F|nr:MMPL family transporter [Sediminicoccus rosea]UPY37589.1 MMPL family transporter [Sediminicoccus rosea]